MNEDLRWFFLIIMFLMLALAILLAWPIILLLIKIVAWAFIGTISVIIVSFGLILIQAVYGAFAETRHPAPKSPLPNKKAKP